MAHISALGPQGAYDSDTIVFDEVADEQLGHKAGDLIFEIEAIPHPIFTRRNDDLYMTMDILLTEALGGFEKTIEHLDGHEVLIKKVGVVFPGEVMTIGREGMPRRGSGGQAFGFLHVKFSIIFPKSITEEQSQAVRQILEKAQW